jgi:hypothetical protein
MVMVVDEGCRQYDLLQHDVPAEAPCHLCVTWQWEEYAKLKSRSNVLRPLNVLTATELVVVRAGDEGLAEEVRV